MASIERCNCKLMVVYKDHLKCIVFITFRLVCVNEFPRFSNIVSFWFSLLNCGDGYLLIPGLINGHGHGRGLSTFQRGVMDSGLETWIWDT